MTHASHTQWRGVLPILGMLAIVAIAAIVAYECGRYHRSLSDMAKAAWQRVDWVRVVHVEPEWRAAEPDHHGLAVRR